MGQVAARPSRHLLKQSDAGLAHLATCSIFQFFKVTPPRQRRVPGMSHTAIAKCSRLDASQSPSSSSPSVSFKITAAGSHVRGQIILQGAITGKSVSALKSFFENITAAPVASWRLDMKGLELLSFAGLRHLARFASARRRNGAAVRIVGIHENIFATLLDMKLLDLFLWAD
ncbi:MAG: STAS domain-containing protein [candidate division KSB1 bacterium]|nr:STAS domain-containing protein [candidate division KSB1 bacterium]MDZ7285407.1 STAS domain-containing protein [candidate division KSB1 bacterium]MDZ7298439.1 STAS domain-containing protein [candidate division KSB1 bacterium]MDZ7308530.1 STAS domain-containing protein [candidate division KSB1 bacterium]MDZ7348928.1 STAS domain-containing protein [candidate division KSB1 bacterium]